MSTHSIGCRSVGCCAIVALAALLSSAAWRVRVTLRRPWLAFSCLRANG